MLSRLTTGGLAISNFVVRFLLSLRLEGPATEVSTCYDRGTRDIVGVETREGTDGLDDPVRDL